MAEGRIYVPVTGGTPNNARINKLNDSGGGTAGGFFIHWEIENGITAQSWFCMKEYIQNTGWKALAEAHGKSPDLDGFQAYVKNEYPDLPFLGDLNDIFSVWDSFSKLNFMMVEGPELGLYPDGCIEAL